MADTKMVAIHKMDPDLWARIKIKAIQQRMEVSLYVQQLLRAALKGDSE